MKPSDQTLRIRVAVLFWLGFGSISSASAAVVVTVPDEPLRALDFASPPVELDIDGDGTFDFVIPGNDGQIDLFPQEPNRALAFDQMGTVLAADLQEGSFIGATSEGGLFWHPEQLPMAACANGGGIFCLGPFIGGIEYLGVEIEIEGQTHYGWVEVESRSFVQFQTFHRWAYETEPGVPIYAGRIPEPSVSLLLAGGIALALRRRRT